MLKISNDYDVHRRSMTETVFINVCELSLAKLNAGLCVGKRRPKRCGVIPPLHSKFDSKRPKLGMLFDDPYDMIVALKNCSFGLGRNVVNVCSSITLMLEPLSSSIVRWAFSTLTLEGGNVVSGLASLSVYTYLKSLSVST